MKILDFNKSQLLSSKKISLVLLSAILLSSFVPMQTIFAASVTIAFPSDPSDGNLSSPLGTSTSRTPDVAASGSNVYVVWREADDIRFINSTDTGSTFSDTAIDIGDTTGASASGDPKIAFEGSNIYVVWRDGSSIKMINSTNNGDSFSSTVVDLNSTSTSNRDPQVVATSSDLVFTVWRDREGALDNRILFVKSDDKGTTFDSIIEIEADTDSSSPDPQLTTLGSNVYVVWQDSTDILVAKSTDSGDSFPTIFNVGDTSNAATKSLPQIAAAGNNVYVVWREGTTIKAAISDDVGVSFAAASSIGSTGAASTSIPAQIAISGSDAYVVWQDNNDGSGDIKFAKSVDGAAFSSETNLSNNDGLSTLPQIAVSGTNVFVAWEDRTTDSSGDILIKASDDSGATFPTGAGDNVSNTNGDTSTEPVIAASGSKALIAWKDDNPGNNDILFKTATIASIDVSFNQPSYKFSDTATITVNDSGSSGSIIVDVKSTTTDPSTLPITLTEGSPGVFSGTITFTETGSSSGTILKASAGDTITATFSSIDGTSTIFSRTIDFNGITLFNLNSTANIRVTDPNSNLNTGTAETITVTVNSTADPTGITLTLTETGTNTGIFGGTSTDPTKSTLIFTESPGLVSASNTVTVNQTDGQNLAGSNADPNALDKILTDIRSTTDLTGINLELTETGNNTAIFIGTLTLSSTTTDNSTGTLQVTGDDLIVVKNRAGTPVSSLLLVTPKSPQNGALQVTTPGDTNIKAIYKDASITVTLFDSDAGGGGGGGLVRPGLVVNVLAGAIGGALGGGGGSGPPGPTITLGAVAKYDSAVEIISMPQEIRNIVNNHDPHTPLESIIDIYEDFDLPLSINENGFALGGYENTLERQTIKRGEPTEFNIVFYTGSEIAHTSLYFNLGPTRTIAGSDTQVLLYKDKPAEIIDPNGNIATATGSINNEGDLRRVVTFSITFSEDIQWSNSDLVIRSWNDNLSSGDTIVYDAIEILPSIEEIAFEQSIPEPEIVQLKSQYVPIWIKNNAAWWSQEMIDDSDFISGIEYLIQQEIILISDNGEVTNTSNEIPSWIKNNAGWWSEDLITEKEFINGIQWLISNGIMQVTET